MKQIGTVLLLMVLLTGCSKPPEPIARVVTGVQVEYNRNGETISRNYVRHASVQSVLTYLRILRPFGPAIPTGAYDSTCRITLHYSHGPDSVYQQQGNRYLRRDEGDWQTIDESRANLLYPILLLLPSDA